MKPASRPLIPAGRRSHRLSRRLALAGALFAVVVCALYSLFVFIASYSVEDSFFDSLLVIEADYLRSTGQPPRLPFIRLYPHAMALPPELAGPLAGAGQTREFAGSGGRHYHARRIPDGWLVAEVSDYLVVRPQRGAMLRFLFGVSVVILGVALLLGGWWIRRSLAPLGHLAARVQTLQPDALPQHFAAAYPANEIGSLALALEHSLQRIKGFVDRESRFTRDVSHELRTPLTVIRHAAELLELQPLDAHGRAQLQRLRESVVQAELTVATLLALAREELPQLPRQEVDMAALAERLVIRHGHLLEGKPLEVDSQVPAGWKVAAPPGVLDILLGNLIYNAFLYTPAGRVTIGRSGASLWVQDSGPGMPPEVLERLGEEGAKGHNSRGFGIGLALVQRLCERFGWSLSVTSTAQGSRLEVGFGATA